MPKSSVYLDTNIFSALHSDYHSEKLIARRNATEEWWHAERKYFALFASKHTELELSDGVYKGQSEAVAAVKRLPYLGNSKDIETWATLLVDAHIVPSTEVGDAIHLALVIVHKIDCLLTWNQTHLGNPETIKKLKVILAKKEFNAPLIYTPKSIPWYTRGEWLC